ncbi:translation machinery-associated protein 16 [Trichoderma novae-zelandiae]
MPTTLQKTRKQISKKRNGEVNALHEKSRDSLRLHKAGVRDQRLEKLAAARGKREQPIVDRVRFFQQNVREQGSEPLEVPAIQALIHTYVHQYDEEYDAVRKTRRAGRPSSTKEDLLKIKMAALEKEYSTGFLIPDITSAESVKLLDAWEGSWAYLTSLPWIKVTDAGNVRKSELPSKAIV